VVRIATAPSASAPGRGVIDIAALGKFAEGIAASRALNSGGIVKQIRPDTLPDPPDAAHRAQQRNDLVQHRQNLL
jgi:hypothetical protein